MNNKTSLARAAAIALAVIFCLNVPVLPGAPLIGRAAATPPPTGPVFGAGTPTYDIYAAPATLNDPSGYVFIPARDNAGDPSIGIYWNTGAVLYQAFATTYKVVFDANTPAGATWTDNSAIVPEINIDPILYTDHVSGRTFAGGLISPCSNLQFTDDDGSTWTQVANPCTFTNDHETIGGGPWTADFPLSAAPSPLDRAVYYCAQSLTPLVGLGFNAAGVSGSADACATSYDGGATFSAPVPIVGDCNYLHGHVKVGANGVAYLPSSNCGGVEGGMVTTDDGVTWSSYTMPGTTVSGGTGNGNGKGFDPSIDITPDGTAWQSWSDINNHPMVAHSSDNGATWSSPVDLAGTVSPSLVAATFQAVVAGDNGRVSIAYLGTSAGGAGGNPYGTGFAGVWYLFVSTTYDGGTTWTTVQATADPVQRGHIWDNGGSEAQRNLLDFMDAQLDPSGRVVVGFADGCLSCTTEAQSTHAYATIARQTTGKGLLVSGDCTSCGGGTTANPTVTIDSPANSAQVSPSFDILGRVNRDDTGSGANAAPIAAFTCTPTALSLSCPSTSSDSDGSIAALDWNWGDGAHSATSTGSHTYAAAGTYTVVLTVTDNLGATGTASHVFTLGSGGGGSTNCGTGTLALDSASDSSNPAGGAHEALCLGAASDGTTFHFFSKVKDQTARQPVSIYYDVYFTPDFGTLAGQQQLIEVTFDTDGSVSAFWDVGGNAPGPVQVGVFPVYKGDPTRNAAASLVANVLDVSFPLSNFGAAPAAGNKLTGVYLDVNHCEGTTCSIVNDDLVPDTGSVAYTFGSAGGSPPTGGDATACVTYWSTDPGSPAEAQAASQCDSFIQGTTGKGAPCGLYGEGNDPVSCTPAGTRPVPVSHDGLVDFVARTLFGGLNAGLSALGLRGFGLHGPAITGSHVSDPSGDGGPENAGWMDVLGVDVTGETATTIDVVLHVRDMSTQPPSLDAAGLGGLKWNYGAEFCLDNYGQTYSATSGNYQGAAGVVCYRLAAANSLPAPSFSVGSLQQDGSGSCGMTAANVLSPTGSAFDVAAGTVTWRLLKAGLNVKTISGSVQTCNTAPPTAGPDGAVSGTHLTRLTGSTGTMAGLVVTLTSPALGDSMTFDPEQSYAFNGGVSATVPGVPTGLTATAGAGQVSLTWSAPASDGGSAITGYTVRYGTVAGTWTGTASSTAASKVVSGLTAGTTYFFVVAATNAAGTGADSAPASAVPTAAPACSGASGERVEIYDGPVCLGFGATDPNPTTAQGTWTVSVSGLATGGHSLVAKWFVGSGAGQLLASSAALDLTVAEVTGCEGDGGSTYDEGVAFCTDPAAPVVGALALGENLFNQGQAASFTVTGTASDGNGAGEIDTVSAILASVEQNTGSAWVAASGFGVSDLTNTAGGSDTERDFGFTVDIPTSAVVGAYRVVVNVVDNTGLTSASGSVGAFTIRNAPSFGIGFPGGATRLEFPSAAPGGTATSSNYFIVHNGNYQAADLVFQMESFRAASGASFTAPGHIDIRVDTSGAGSFDGIAAVPLTDNLQSLGHMPDGANWAVQLTIHVPHVPGGSYGSSFGVAPV